MKWEPLTDSLIAGNIIPVIGNDLIQVKHDDTFIPLHRYISQKLTQKLNIQYTGQGIGDLDLACPNENVLNSAKNILNNIDKESLHLDLLEKLTEVDTFNFFISTTLDGLLVKTLCKSRSLNPFQVKVIDYSLKNQLRLTSKKGNDPLVTVFNVLGGFENINEAACDDEKMLEHFFSLANKNHINRKLVCDLLDKINGKILLFIGCDFPDWFMRFIIRIISNERYSERQFSDYIVWDTVDKDSEGYKFLSRFKKNIFPPEGCSQGNVERFIRELHEKWLDAQKNLPIHYEGTVFLSYNSPDAAVAKRLKKILRAEGIRHVWFDKEDLKIGKHEPQIREEIRNCKVFIPLISNHALSVSPTNESYFRDKEWKYIEGRLEYDENKERNFLLFPIVIDDTAHNDSRIPKFMRDFVIRHFPQEQERIVVDIKKELNPCRTQTLPGK